MISHNMRNELQYQHRIYKISALIKLFCWTRRAKIILNIIITLIHVLYIFIILYFDKQKHNYN